MQDHVEHKMVFLSPYFYTQWVDFLNMNKMHSLKKRARKEQDVVINHPCNWIKVAIIYIYLTIPLLLRLYFTGESY